MNILKHHKRIFALLVLFSFLFLLEASSMPLGAEPSRASGDEQAPGSIEREGGSGLTLHKKSPVIPIIIGLLALGAIVVVLILAVFKTKYAIAGTWSITMNRIQPDVKTWPANIEFDGDNESGIATYMDMYDTIFYGIYSMNGKNVSANFQIDSQNTLTFSGKFDSKEKMSGTWSRTPNATGTWIAIL